MAKQAKSSDAQRDSILLWTWILSIAVILLTVYVRIRLLNVPLERDEGEFGYMGQLMLKGIPPYKLAYNMKLPGIYAIYALIMAAFGQTPAGIRIGLLLANLTATGLVFLLGRRLRNTQTALIAAAVYPVLTLGQAVAGPSAHATQFLMPMVLGALLLLLTAIESNRPRLLFWSGLLMGLAFITKQHAIIFGIFGGCYVLQTLIRERKPGVAAILARTGVYTAGVIIPYAVVCFMMYRAGVFDKFWFWTVTYSRAYVSETPFLLGLWLMLLLSKYRAAPVAVLIVLAGAGLFATWYDRKLRERALFVTGFFLFGFLAVCPGFYFRDHYYVQVMPAVALLIGVAATWIGQLLGRFGRPVLVRIVPLLLFAAGITHAMIVGWDLFFVSTPEGASRIIYGDRMFPEAAKVARYVRAHTKPSDRIAVLGSEPEIYFLADRLSATGYIYTYGLVEYQPYAQRMQKEMISEIEAGKPKYIVYTNAIGSWQFRRKSDLTILHWLTRYASKYYRIVGLVDMVTEDQTNYYWGEDASFYAADSPCGLFVLERKQP